MPTNPTTTAGNGGGDLSMSWQGAAEIPKMMDEVRNGILALKGMISAPAAAQASGSIPLGIAIAALGIELGAFIYRTGEALAHDAESLLKNIANYQLTEQDIAAIGTGVMSTLIGAANPIGSLVSAGVTATRPQGSVDRVALPAGAK